MGSAASMKKAARCKPGGFSFAAVPASFGWNQSLKRAGVAAYLRQNIIRPLWPSPDPSSA
jgi:hypothetical protein